MGKKRAKRVEFVLDCSIAMAWFFEDEADAYADKVQEALAVTDAVVPSLWPLEVANALLMGERRKRTTEAKVTAFLALVKALPITTDDETAAHAWTDALRLARAHKLSVYDATYLELALRRKLRLATLDADLKAAARAAGVAEFVPP